MSYTRGGTPHYLDNAVFGNPLHPTQGVRGWVRDQGCNSVCTLLQGWVLALASGYLHDLTLVHNEHVEGHTTCSHRTLVVLDTPHCFLSLNTCGLVLCTGHSDLGLSALA